MARVLVVDDEEDIRFIIGGSLERWGHEWTGAADAAEAYAACEASVPDVMLLDVSMPGETGRELLERLVRDGLVPPAVALLSAALPGQLGTVAKERGIRHLQKPFGLEDLEALLDEMVAEVS